jgi:hypothetical protein
MLRTMRLAAIAWAIVTAGVLAGGGPDRIGRAQSHVFEEIAWPFPRDGWPAGRAFRCTAASCASEMVELYARPKLGFCNCDTGVADDDEVDRVADVDLTSTEFESREVGEAVRVMGLGGRMRSYELTLADRSHRTAVAIALSYRCDLLVAVAQGRAEPRDLQRAMLQFLDSNQLRSWIVTALGSSQLH